MKLQQTWSLVSTKDSLSQCNIQTQHQLYKKLFLSTHQKSWHTTPRCSSLCWSTTAQTNTSPSCVQILWQGDKYSKIRSSQTSTPSRRTSSARGSWPTSLR